MKHPMYFTLGLVASWVVLSLPVQAFWNSVPFTGPAGFSPLTGAGMSPWGGMGSMPWGGSSSSMPWNMGGMPWGGNSSSPWSMGGMPWGGNSSSPWNMGGMPWGGNSSSMPWNMGGMPWGNNWDSNNRKRNNDWATTLFLLDSLNQQQSPQQFFGMPNMGLPSPGAGSQPYGYGTGLQPQQPNWQMQQPRMMQPAAPAIPANPYPAGMMPQPVMPARPAFVPGNQHPIRPFSPFGVDAPVAPSQPPVAPVAPLPPAVKTLQFPDGSSY